MSVPVCPKCQGELSWSNKTRQAWCAKCNWKGPIPQQELVQVPDETSEQEWARTQPKPKRGSPPRGGRRLSTGLVGERRSCEAEVGPEWERRPCSQSPLYGEKYCRKHLQQVAMRVERKSGRRPLPEISMIEILACLDREVRDRRTSADQVMKNADRLEKLVAELREVVAE